MQFKVIKNLLETRIAPKEYLINGEIYGLQYGQADDTKLIKRILLTPDLNFESIHFATVNKTNLILSYNSLINEPISKFNLTLIKKLTLLSNYPLLIYPLNSSLVAAEGGTSDTLMELLYLELEKPLEIRNNKNISIPIGRICLPKSYPENVGIITLEKLLKRIKSNLEVDCLSFVGDLKSQVKKICVIGSDINDIELLRKVTKNGCDCFVSGTINNQFANLANELELKLIQIPLYSCLNVTFKKIAQYLSLEFPYDDFIYYKKKELIKNYN